MEQTGWNVRIETGSDQLYDDQNVDQSVVDKSFRYFKEWNWSRHEHNSRAVNKQLTQIALHNSAKINIH